MQVESYKLNGGSNVMIALQDILELNVEDQCGILWNNWRLSLGAISKSWWADEATLSSNLQTGHSNVPAFNDIAFAECELESRSGLGGIKGFVVGLQATFVVNLDLFSRSSFGSFSNFQVLNHQTALKLLDLSLVCVFLFLLFLLLLLSVLQPVLLLFLAVLISLSIKFWLFSWRSWNVFIVRIVVLFVLAFFIIVLLLFVFSRFIITVSSLHKNCTIKSALIFSPCVCGISFT